jgi:hypothetical protein
MPGNQLSLSLFPQAYIAPIAVSLQAYVYTKHYIKLSSLAKGRFSGVSAISIFVEIWRTEVTTNETQYFNINSLNSKPFDSRVSALLYG